MAIRSKMYLGRAVAALAALIAIQGALPKPTAAQDRPTPKWEVFGGYSYLYPNTTLYGVLPLGLEPVSSSLEGNPRGFGGSVTYNVNHWLGFTLDSSKQLHSDERGVDERIDDAAFWNVSFGPKITYRTEHFSPFAEFLVGDHSFSPDAFYDINKVGFMIGGGLDFNINRNFALRLLRADFVYSNYRYGPADVVPSTNLRGARLQSGIVIMWGGEAPPPPPNRFPTASCSIDKPMVYAESGDTAIARAAASDPDNDPLSYSWSANGGAVDGNGPEARWNSAGAAVGTYSIKVRVEDGRGGTARCSADIRVEPRPNRPPTISCAADNYSVLAGVPIQITATASDPDNDPLTYSWNASSGRVRGSGASVIFDTSERAPGPYTVTGRVDDGRTGTAECKLALTVQEPPRIKELESSLDLHSIYFPTAQPYAAHPDRGLVASQRQILETLSSEFKEYLGYRPNAHLILGGHADHRGSQEYNKGLTERRVARTKSFLVEHGVPADNIETRSFGEDDNLSADQVKEQIASNPDLTQDERQQMLNNLNVLVLANNRRVDVSLTTTGQQSTRRYPFNAKDYLALINTKGGDKKGEK